ncbi:MAG: IS1595 family transposase, partial [Hyphomicrobium sp.]|nr:IS1595 family transposase [Hyphomicrobium sp.]
MSADLTNPIFTNETAAREYLEASRWPDQVSCPHCGSLDGITKLAGKTTRPGLFACSSCRGQFSVRVGTIYERSHIPLHKWLLATHLLLSSKKGMSSHQLSRMLGITYKSAWFLSHRIRETLAPVEGTPPLGGEGKTVEVDETYIGRKRGRETKKAMHHKNAVVSLVERGGDVRSFKVERANIHT